MNARRFARGVDLARNLGDGLGQVFHLDALGTVQALSAADGSEVTRYGVDPWGKVLSGSAAGNAYVYHGGLGYWEEPGAGLSYVRARWLEPETGSWLSVDPVSGEPRYAYARQMPTRLVDPEGTESVDQWFRSTVLDPLATGGRRAVRGGFEHLFRFAGLPPSEAQLLARQVADTVQTVAVERIQEFLTRAQALLAATEHRYQVFRTSLPQVVRNVAPEHLTEVFPFYGGMLVGLCKAAIGFLPFSWILDVLELIPQILEAGPNLQNLLNLAIEPFQGLLTLFQQEVDLPAYDRGEIVGSALGSMVGLIVTVILAVATAGGLAPLVAAGGAGVGHTVRGIAQGIRKLPKNVGKRLRATALAVSIARPTVTEVIAGGQHQIRSALGRTRGAGRARQLDLNPPRPSGTRRLAQRPYGEYQRLAAESDVEKMFTFADGRQIGIDNLVDGVIICAKFYGTQDGAWGRYLRSHPENPMYLHVRAGFIAQAEGLLRFNNLTGGKGVVYRFASEQARQHYHDLLLTHPNRLVREATEAGMIQTEMYLFRGPRRGPRPRGQTR